MRVCLPAVSLPTIRSLCNTWKGRHFGDAPVIAVDCPYSASATDQVDDQKRISIRGSQSSSSLIVLGHAEHCRPVHCSRANGIGCDIVRAQSSNRLKLLEGADAVQTGSNGSSGCLAALGGGGSSRSPLSMILSTLIRQSSLRCARARIVAQR
jgi:hypothetical protein